METIIVLSTTLLLINIVHLFFKKSEFDWFNWCITYSYLAIILILALSINSKPKAIDVYRGKTSLEITYKNEVPIDSVVVWK